MARFDFEVGKPFPEPEPEPEPEPQRGLRPPFLRGYAATSRTMSGADDPLCPARLQVGSRGAAFDVKGSAHTLNPLGKHQRGMGGTLG